MAAKARIASPSTLSTLSTTSTKPRIPSRFAEKNLPKKDNSNPIQHHATPTITALHIKPVPNGKANSPGRLASYS